MKTKPNSPAQQPDPANVDATPTRPDVTREFETLAGQLAGVADRAGGWAKEQVHAGLQDFVSRVLYGETGKTPEPEKDKEQEIDKGRER
jgi:hypothetical protein